jgi:hypothetical protein
MSVDGLLPRYIAVDQAAPGANTAIISGGLIPKMGGAFRISVVLATASVFNVTVTPAAGTQRTHGLNQSTALNAGDLYTFCFGVATVDQNSAALTYNFEVETNSIIRYLLVEEVSGGVI